MYKEAFRQMQQPAIMSGEDYIVRAINKAYTELFGLEEEEVIGRHLHKIFKDLPASSRILTQIIDSDEEDLSRKVSFTMGEKTLYLDTHTTRFKDSEGNPCIVTLFTDLTHQRRREEDMKRMILDMTVNVVPLSDEVGVLPLPPILRDEQKWIIVEKTAEICRNERFSKLAINLSGITSLDEELGDILVRLIEVLRILGVEVILTGVRHETAADFAGLEIEFDRIRVYQNLKQAVEYFLTES
ncbi:STAS domain-containing protein [Alteribacter natronophilus]|uniref:STAS domain-containing protein n=1 Tax=Alteribacter natronophilus TaxID=2583810 RepID=UPI00110F1A87|nr:STAS domain-containing protein [Alteribacter natronophilus]TMW70633.1 PAS domain S-box protein [Alteribacter natronophilus]